MPDVPLITLTTDFGWQDSYVAEMKGVILGINPSARLIDVTHDVRPQDVARGAFLLDMLVDRFPPGTVHVAVIDPGVGSSRRILVAEVAGQRFVLPDNGLLTEVLARYPADGLIEVSNGRYFLDQVSTTFHGRDVMAPVAAHLTLGVDPYEMGPALADQPVLLSLPFANVTAEAATGCVVTADRFGNLITNIRAERLPASDRSGWVVDVGGLEVLGVNAYYSQRMAGSLMVLVGSHGRLEIAISGGDARGTHQIADGTPVRVSFPTTSSLRE